MDIAGAVSAFLNAPANTNAQNKALQQKLVVGSFMNYMSNYIAWANAGFPNNGMKTTLSSIQSSMMGTAQGLFQSGGNPDYYPINQGLCQ